MTARQLAPESSERSPAARLARSTAGPTPEKTTQERIERAAVASFAELGYHATSMRAIASEAGIKAASLYHWYPSKQELLVSISRGYLTELHRRVEAAIRDQPTPTDRFAVAVWTHVLHEGSHQEEAFVTDRELRALTGEGREEILGLRKRYERIFEGIIRDGIAAGEFECREPQIATFAILLECTGVAVWFRPDGRLSLTEVAHLHVELVLNSLRARSTLDASAGAFATDRSAPPPRSHGPTLRDA